MSEHFAHASETAPERDAPSTHMPADALAVLAGFYLCPMGASPPDSNTLPVLYFDELRPWDEQLLQMQLVLGRVVDAPYLQLCELVNAPNDVLNRNCQIVVEWFRKYGVGFAASARLHWKQ